MLTPEIILVLLVFFFNTIWVCCFLLVFYMRARQAARRDSINLAFVDILIKEMLDSLKKNGVP
jgi:hypothetical protein